MAAVAAPPQTRRESFRQAWDVLVALTKSDVKLRYGRGPLRRLKWIADPIAALGVYVLLIAFVIDNEGRAAALSVACAVVPFQLVMMTVVNALRAVEVRKPIIGNMSFRRMLIPVSCAMTEGVGFLGCLFLLPLTMIIHGVAPTWAVLFLPVMIAVTFALAVAIAYPATLLGIWMPEVAPFLISAVRTLFFLAPGLIALREIYGVTDDLIVFNPVTGIFEGFRDCLLYGQVPQAWEVFIPLGYAVLIAAVFVPLYRRESKHFAKLLS
jgi:ABC-type polysaccharide/polyol phosphate export permease